jgi:hypothetical protein
MIPFSWRKKTMLSQIVRRRDEIEEQLYKNCSENTMGWPMRGREGQGTGFGSPERVPSVTNGTRSSFPIPLTRVLLLIVTPHGLAADESG